MKAGIAGFVVLCTALNLFQWWQLMEGIYDPYRTTKAYYWAIFLRTKAPANGEQLKSVFRSFEPNQQWTDRERYRMVKSVQLIHAKGDWSKEEAYGKLTPKDHAWIGIDIRYETTDSAFTDGPFLVANMLYKDQAYGYQGPTLASITDTVNGELVIHYNYLTPEPRTTNDQFFTYIWNPAHNNLRIVSYEVNVYTRKD
jgi:hypothetical protein